MTVTAICRIVIAAVLLLPLHALSQKVDLPRELWVNCDPPSGKNAVVVGPTVTAKNGSRAWVQVVSVVAPPSTAEWCLNTTTLWVSRGDLHPYLPIFTQSPVYPNLEGNGMHIVDWSADGQLLLTEMWQWNTEPNDAPIPRSILVFEPQKTGKHEIDIYRLEDDQKGRDCEVQFDLFGFTPDDWVALKARISTFYEADENETTKPKNRKCRESTQWLAINPFTQARRSIPSNFHAARYSDSN
jgi:hypothetical protein